MSRSAPPADALLLTPEQAAAMLQIGRTKLYALMKCGEIPSIPLGRCRRIPRAWLEGYIAAKVAEWEAARASGA